MGHIIKGRMWKSFAYKMMPLFIADGQFNTARQHIVIVLKSSTNDSDSVHTAELAAVLRA